MTENTNLPPLPGAATQYANALVNAITYANFYEEMRTYWQEKLVILSQVHGITTEYLQHLLEDHSDPSVELLIRNVVSGGGAPGSKPTLLVKLALTAAMQAPSPFYGVLAINPNTDEREAWITGSKEIEQAVEDYRSASVNLLARLLMAALPSLTESEVTDEILQNKGLPTCEPHVMDFV